MNYLTEFHREKLHGWMSLVKTDVTASVILIRNGFGKFGGYYITNPNSYIVYMQVFDALDTDTVTLGTTTPDMTYGIPATGGANLELERGRRIDRGIRIAATTTATGLTAATLGLDVTIYYL